MSTGSSRMRGATPAAGDPFGFADAATEGVACRVGDSIAIGCAFEPRSVCEAIARLKTAAPAPAKPAMKRRFLLLRSGVAGAGTGPAGALGPGLAPDTSPGPAGVSAPAEWAPYFLKGSALCPTGARAIVRFRRLGLPPSPL